MKKCSQRHWTCKSTGGLHRAQWCRRKAFFSTCSYKTGKGRFCKLRCLQVSLHYETDFASKLQRDFMRSLLTLAGSWELHSCHIHGCLSLRAAAALLPSCLQHIALSSTDMEPMDCFVLKDMQRFPDLCTLQFASDIPESLYLTVCLPSLSTLHVHGNLVLTVTSMSLLQILPNMRHLACCVYDTDLQKVLSMPQLVYARLDVECPEETGLYITVGATSKLRFLVLKSLPFQELQLSVFQPLLSYFVHCSGVDIKHNFDEHTSSVHAPPLLFKMHSELR